MYLREREVPTEIEKHVGTSKGRYRQREIKRKSERTVLERERESERVTVSERE